MSGNRMKEKKDSCICLEQISMKISSSSATLKVAKESSNIYCTWQKPKEFTKSQEKKILPWIAESLFLFTSF